MCGRFAITLPKEAMVQAFDAIVSNDLPDTPNFNVCPTNSIHTVISENGRRLMPMRWGFIPHWYKKPSDGPLLINARSETLADKPAFRSACRERRCLIPATGFYEWTKDAENNRLPWYITRNDQSPLVFAGVWQRWEVGDQSLTSCAIVTTQAGPEMARIHKREPVCLQPDDYGMWLGEQGKGAARLMSCAPDGFFTAVRVSPNVNSNRAHGPELIEPLEN